MGLQRMRLSLRTSLIVVTVGASLLGLARAESDLHQWWPTLPQELFNSALIAGAILVAYGIVSIVWGVMTQGLSGLREKLRPEYEHRTSFYRELPIIYEFAKNMLGEDVSTLRQVRQVHDANKDAIHVVTEVRDSLGERTSERFAGFFSLIPLRKAARTAMEEEELVGADVVTDHVARDWESAHGYYIGGVGARFRARPATMAYLKETVRNYIRHNPNPVFTRPINQTGLRLCLQNGFRPVNSSVDDQVGILYVRRVGDS